MSYKTTVGSTVRLVGDFADDGTPVDPTTVVCQVQHPSGAITSPAVTKEETGEYTATVTVDAPGLWTYFIEGTGANPQRKYGVFRVEPAPF